MIKQLLLITFLGFYLNLSAQSNKTESNFNGFHQAPLYTTVSLDESASAQQFLEELMAPNQIEVEKVKSLISSGGKHDYYRIKKDQIPFYGIQAVAHDYNNGTASVQYPVLGSVFQGDFSSSVDLELLKGDLKATKYKSKPVYWSNQNNNFKALRTDFFGTDGLHYILISAANEILVLEDLRSYLQTGDSTCSALVFAPDPLSTANVNYGGLYVDNNDGPMPLLDLERQNISFKALYDNGTFKLENPDIKISEFSAPILAPYTQTTPNFNLTRDEDGFEDVNTFVHLSNFKKYIDSLGFSSIPGNQIEIDVHAISNSDNSYYSPSEFRIYMGEGGVDDAEDADVIIHEYGHALISAASIINGRINERAGMDEAICDYFAFSYSRKFTNNQSNRVFNWDGHNEFWSGRSTVSSKNYQFVNFSDIYLNTDLLVSCLHEILINTSRTVSDKIIFEALFTLQASSTYRDFAIMVINADQVLNGGQNFNIIKAAFVRRNVLEFDFTLSENKVNNSSISAYNSFAFASGGELLIKANEELVSYQIVNLEGKEIQRGKLTGFQAVINAPSIKTGLYLVLIKGVQTTKSFKVFRN
jgi:hypothetical protein